MSWTTSQLHTTLSASFRASIEREQRKQQKPRKTLKQTTNKKRKRK